MMSLTLVLGAKMEVGYCFCLLFVAILFIKKFISEQEKNDVDCGHDCGHYYSCANDNKSYEMIVENFGSEMRIAQF